MGWLVILQCKKPSPLAKMQTPTKTSKNGVFFILIKPQIYWTCWFNSKIGVEEDVIQRMTQAYSGKTYSEYFRRSTTELYETRGKQSRLTKFMVINCLLSARIGMSILGVSAN